MNTASAVPANSGLSRVQKNRGILMDYDHYAGMSDDIEIIPTRKPPPSKEDKGISAKYCIKDDERKLPLPIFFWSEREREAFIQNKCEQSRLNILLDHFSCQETNSKRRIRCEAKLVRSQTIKTLSHIPNFAFENLSKRRATSALPDSRPRSSVNVTRKGSRKKSKSVPDLQETADDSFILTGQTQTGEKITPSATPISLPDEKGVSFDQTRDTTSNKQQTIRAKTKVRSQSAFPGTRQTTKDIDDIAEQRCKTAPLMRVGSDEEEDVDSVTEIPITARSRKRRPSYFDRAHAEYNLRREIRQNTYRREIHPPPDTFDLKKEVRKQKVVYKGIQDKIKNYLEDLKHFNKQPLDKWNVKEFEDKLNLQ